MAKRNIDDKWPMLNIGLDYRQIDFADGTGIIRYRNNLRDTLLHNGAEITSLSDQNSAENNAEHNQNITRPDIYRRAVRRFRFLNMLTKIDLYQGDKSAKAPSKPISLFHWSHPLPLMANECLNIYTIHDMIPILQPHLTGISSRRYQKLLRALIASGAYFTTVSQSVRQQFINWSGIDGERVICTYQMVPPVHTSSRQSEADHITQREEPYLLILGRVEARKNIISIIKAWELAGRLYPLKIIGPDGYWPNRKDKNIVDKLIQQNGIERLPWLPQNKINEYICNAHALLMPSLAEGFGLPVIEAMAAGIPTLSSDNVIMREISAGASLAVNPMDIEDMAKAITELCMDKALRTKLIKQGKGRAEHFSQSSFAMRLLPAYSQFLQCHHGNKQ